MKVAELRSEERDDEFEPEWHVSWYDYLPAAVLALIMTLLWATHLATGGMDGWGVSARALAEGRYETIPLHMFAHGGWSHLLMNSAALLEIGGLVVTRLGGFPGGWLRFLAAFGLSGLLSMVFYLSFHPDGTVPVIGASGAIYGLVGLLLFIRLEDEMELVRLRQMPAAFLAFLENNMLFLALLLVGGVLAGLSGGVAWEAHLGGFLFGFCVGPWLLPVSLRNRELLMRE